jgi:hypothetical protein
MGTCGNRIPGVSVFSSAGMIGVKWSSTSRRTGQELASENSCFAKSNRQLSTDP